MTRPRSKPEAARPGVLADTGTEAPRRGGVAGPGASAGQAPRWTREQIRDARLMPLAPFLERRGLRLVESGGGNVHVANYPGLIVKESYWRWPERGLSGNAIDLCTQVLRLSFHEAMRELSAS
jgi:hypothetical protein